MTSPLRARIRTSPRLRLRTGAAAWLVGIGVVVLVAPRSGRRPTPGRPAPGTGTRWVRVPDYARYTRVAKTAVVCDETGTPTAWHVTGAGAKEASARPELRFQATDSRRYFPPGARR